MIEGALAGLEFELTQPRALLGRDPSADIRIVDDIISRKHACISLQGDRYFLEDQGSSNGTYLNGKMIKEATPLSSGDQISLGHAVVMVFEDPGANISVTHFAQQTMIETPQTIVEDLAGKTQHAAPARQASVPRLVVTVTGAAPSTYPLGREQITIGRAEDNDIIIPSPIISRHHARLERSGAGYQLVVLPEAANKLLLGGRALTGKTKLYDCDEIHVDSSNPGMLATLTYLSPSEEQRPQTISLATLAAAAPSSGHQVFDQTLMDAGQVLQAVPLVPPQLVITVAGQPPRTHTLTRDQITIGRSEENDVVISSQIVSRRHARLERVTGGYQLVVLPDVSNGLVCQGKPVTGQVRLHHGDIFRIDSEIPGMMVSMSYQSPSEAAQASESLPILFGDKDKLSFGRDPANDVQLNVPTVSRYHAQVERIGRRYRLTDLKSANGTFVNDERIEGQVWLSAQDTVRIGPYRFVMGEDQFIRYDETNGLRVEAVGINKWVRKNLNILQDISLVFQPREFIVVVGQSGGGKSTLVDAVAGYRPATHGRVLVNGIDVYRNFDAIRNEIGYVPQRDIIHMELTVYQALDYAARLRMPRDTSKTERHKRIMEVLEDLDLLHRKDVQISGLSGGQQKRVSIGVELLTRPGLFFLDEPTSGLDPGTETAFMHLMRRLADQGRTIIMVTHATKNVMLADKVVFLARGGYLAWFGPPDEALAYFDQFRTERERRSKEMEFDQIYAILDDQSKGNAKEWAKRYQEHPAYRKYIVEPLQSRQGALPLVEPVQAAGPKAAKRLRKQVKASALSQFMVLSARNVKILTRDRSSLILMLVAPPLVGMLDFIIAPLMGRAPFDYQSGDAYNGAITLFLLTVYCLLVGGLSQMREFVKESEIYKRERLVNLKIFPYVSSKVWVAMLLAFYQAAAYTVIHFLAFKMPGGSAEFGMFYITVVLAVMAGMIGGLLASAISPAASSAPMIMILLIVPQIVLSGVLAPVPSTVSSIASTRWAFQAFIGITGAGSDVARDPCWKLDKDLRDAMTLEQKEANGCNCMGAAVFDPQSCNFPGVGQYYEAEINQVAPVEPPGLRERPGELVIPAAPEAPANKYDQVAMAQYMTALQSYQDEVLRIQDDYKNQMDLYEAEGKVYQAEMVKYQEALAKYEMARNSAAKGAEGVIEGTTEMFGWGWVNKGDPKVFWPWLFNTWIAQGVIIFVYFLAILLLIKRKDVS
jgi:ABC-type multidrug transport system ATPase subunit/pSer/pThr/pTyr-binding forkhead associated (FHA) protein